MSGNWVEQRYAIENCLTNQKGEVWNQVRAALQDACKSFRDHYASSVPAKLTDQLENGSRIRISLPFPVPMRQTGDQITGIVVLFNASIPAIDWADDDGSHRALISSDEKEAFIVDAGKRITPDELSRKILEPLFFAKQ